jgi:lysophospholipase L1-like esterase
MWCKIESEVMSSLLEMKYKVSRAFREKLQSTGSCKLLHSVSDRKWGIGTTTTAACHPIGIYKGKNLMGELLVQCRERLSGFQPQLQAQLQQHIPPTQHITTPVAKSSSTNKVPCVILVGNSLISGIDENRLCNQVDVHKQITHTITDAKKCIPENAELIIYQLGTNDVKFQSADQVITEMRELVSITHKKVPRSTIAISLAPMQRGHHEINAKLKVLNAYMELVFERTNVILCQNNNITTNYLAEDGVHLNKAGSSILANNIRSTIGQVFNVSFRLRETRYVNRGYHQSNNRNTYR